MDKNEKKFLLKSPFLKNSSKSEKSIVLVQMPMDYFYDDTGNVVAGGLLKPHKFNLKYHLIEDSEVKKLSKEGMFDLELVDNKEEDNE